MDCRSSCHEPIPRAGRHAPAHNGENLQLAAPGLHELEAQVRYPEVALLPGAFALACAPMGVWRPPHCPDRRRSAINASRPAALAGPPSGRGLLRRATADHRGTELAGVPAARTR